MSADEMPLSQQPIGPFDHFELDALLAGAARLRPDHHAITDMGGQSLNFAEFDRQCHALAAALIDVGLTRGQRLAICADARSLALIGLIGGLRAGLDVIMVPHFCAQHEFNELCARTQPHALMCYNTGPDNGLIEMMFATAAQTRSVKLVASLDEQRYGVAYMAPHQLDNSHPRPRQSGLKPARIISVAANMNYHMHEQKLLISTALDYVTRAQIGMRHSIVSVLSPTSLAGQISGLVASLISGASLILHAPFDSSLFMQALEQHQPCHLIVPALMAPMIVDAGLVHNDILHSLTLHYRADVTPAARGQHDVRTLALLSDERETQLAISVIDKGKTQTMSVAPSTLTAHHSPSPAHVPVSAV
jgi:acyl-CoA synthetase (AMP-forming)/AMP-acid ligase II